MTIFFDLDGTIVDLYGVDNWLEYLLAADPYPYATAKPLINLSTLARVLHRLQRQGVRIGVITWLSKNADASYNELVTATKKEWLDRHLKSVNFDEIHIVPYGTPKEKYCKSVDDILFDDEERNRKHWTGKAFDVTNIIEELVKI